MDILYSISPVHGGTLQGEELFQVTFLKENNKKQCVAVWDYKELYRHPYLYEYLYRDLLRLNAPDIVWDYFDRNFNNKSKTLRVLDLAAGSGLSGQTIKNTSNVDLLIGIDILEEAKVAYERDYGDIYDVYYVMDFNNLSDYQVALLQGYRFNCLVVVSASGGSDEEVDYHDVELNEYKQAFDILMPNGFLVFNIREHMTTGQSMIVE